MGIQICGMRILLVGNDLSDAQQSMTRYAAWLERLLNARGYKVSLIRPHAVFSRLAGHGTLRKYLGYIDKFLLFPPHLRRQAGKSDLVHVLDHSNAMYLRWAGKRPSLITCHDMLAIRAARGEFAEAPTGWTGRILQRWILAGLCRASHLLCVSAKTASDLIALTGENGAQVRVIRTALNWSYSAGGELSEPLRARLGLKPGEVYLLHVGGDQWYKNRRGVVEIFARLVAMEEFTSLRLVMAGRNWPVTLRRRVEELHLQGLVVEATGLSNEELRALYCNAWALLFPSLQEGFGWPIIEAQACGCPVITSARAPMTEVAGDAAVFIDPVDAQSAAASIAAGMRQRDKLRQAGHENLHRFDEEQVADQYCAFYDEILHVGARLPRR
jgi:glycosyltransferase involved in cell wall biosynthesis